ncbi:TIGR04283 family arsenosugar biosynthesis glycosyltransferase [Owenweeksia hongkongensis]|uniref:TIGR04283 family arsenosugar biosynthesis glycosyltransferase n=1 Tax=Owenweeksia hongkongensis TaxID=253245 RepID=UPI003A957276
MHNKISVIIPTYNEGDHIANLISEIKRHSVGLDCEIIVADGGSIDETAESVLTTTATLVRSSKKGRGAQLNAGAEKATGNILFFLHADSQPPEKFLHDVLEAVKSGHNAGCFRLKFDSNHWFLKANAWFTRFNVNAVRFGDQGLFVTRELFDKTGGYRSDYILLEDQEMVIRLKKFGAQFKVLKKSMTTSARKYLENGVISLQLNFFIIWWNYYLGKSQAELVKIYKKRILDTKIQEEDATPKEALAKP